MSKFDLTRALQCEPVRLRNGTKAFITHQLDKELVLNTGESEPYELIGFTVSNGKFSGVMCWTLNGNFFQDVEGCQLDIVEMWEKEINTVTVKLPRPLNTAELNQRVYLITAKGICSQVYKETASDLLMLEEARFFATREDAQAWDDLAKRVRDM